MFYQLKPLTKMEGLKNLQTVSNNLSKLATNMECKGINGVFLNLGEPVEYDKPQRIKGQEVASDDISNDEERDLAKAYTNLDNEGPDQFDDF